MSVCEPETKLNHHGEMSATVSAGINIALIKYWGKRDATRNLPAVGSLSLTLAPWGSTTALTWLKGAEHRFTLNGAPQDDKKVLKLLREVQRYAGLEGYVAHIESRNSVPTAAGLASSASGMAALGLAAWRAAGLDYSEERPPPQLIELVRVGSGSAPRSLIGGLVRLERDGLTLRQLSPPEGWPLSLLVAVVSRGPKEVSSRDGMELTRRTSPYFQAWVESHPADLDEAERAIERRDLEALGEVMEHSTAKMHACAWGARPPLRYIQGVSLMVLDRVRSLRQEGVGAWATMDAGPHVKVLCSPQDQAKIHATLSALDGVLEVLTLTPGAGARELR